MGEWLSRLAETLAGLDPAAVVGVVALIVALEAFLLTSWASPGETTLVLTAAGLAAAGGPWPLLLVAAACGALVGEGLGYLLGRRLGPRLRSGRLGARIGAERWAHAEQMLVRRGRWAMLTFRFLGPAQSVTPALAGTLQLPYGRFLSWSVPGIALWAGVYVGIGALAGEAAPRIGRWLGTGGVVALVVALAALAVWWLARRRSPATTCGSSARPGPGRAP